MARTSEHRELAAGVSQAFRTEITTNRDALASRKDYHATLKQELTTYFDSDAPKTPARFGETVHMTAGISPVFFEQAAWDLAIATQALAYIDADLPSPSHASIRRNRRTGSSSEQSFSQQSTVNRGRRISTVRCVPS